MPGGSRRPSRSTPWASTTRAAPTLRPDGVQKTRRPAGRLRPGARSRPTSTPEAYRATLIDKPRHRRPGHPRLAVDRTDGRRLQARRRPERSAVPAQDDDDRRDRPTRREGLRGVQRLVLRGTDNKLYTLPRDRCSRTSRAISTPRTARRGRPGDGSASWHDGALCRTETDRHVGRCNRASSSSARWSG